MALSEVYIGPIVAEDITRVYLGSTLIFERGTGIDLDLGIMTFNGFVPSVDYTLELNTGEFVAAGYSPELGFTINASLGELTFTGYEPALFDLTDGLVSQYNFNESSGNLLDQVGSNDGTVTGATQNGTDYTFDGVNDYVNVPADASINNLSQADMSLSVWVKPDTSTPTVSRRFASKRGGASNHGWIFFQDASNKVGFTTVTSGTSAIANGTTSINTNTWYHVVAVYDQSNRSVKIYVNGADETTSATNGTADPTSETGDMKLGASFNLTSNQYFDGDMDNFRIYDRAISAAEVTEIYNLEIADILTKGLISSYDFNESSGNLLDQVGSNHGTVVGATQNGSEYVFDGVNDYVSFGDVAEFSFGDSSTDSPFSISAWINMDSFSTNNPIVSKYRDTTSDDGEWTFIVNTAGEVELALIDSAVANRETRKTTNTLSASTWYHVVATYDGTGGSSASGGIEIYIDSVKETSYGTNDAGTYVAMHNTTTPVLVGSQLQDFSTPQYFDGSIDNLRIYDRAISSAEVTEIYNLEIADILTKGLISQYNFNESSGNLLDQVGSNDGTVTGATQNGSEYSFDGVNDYVSVNGLVTSLASTTEGSWSVWVKPVDATPTTINTIFSVADTNTAEFLQLRIETSGLARFLCVDAGAVVWDLDTDAAQFSDNTWTHVVGVQDGVSPVIYINGVAVAQTFTVSTDKTKWFSDVPNVDNANIGSLNRNSLGNDLFLDGSIDNLRIYDRAISASEVTEIYNLGRS